MLTGKKGHKLVKYGWRYRTFTSESVTQRHPDEVADIISMQYWWIYVIK